MTIHDDVDTLKANEQHRLNVLRRFKRALLASEVSALPDLCASIDGECIWPEAWERVMTIKHLSDDVKEFFVRLWLIGAVIFDKRRAMICCSFRPCEKSCRPTREAT